jgi:hypothetical protein
MEMMSKVSIGQQFTRWTVKAPAKAGKLNNTRWLCACQCGKERVVDQASLLRGMSRSCGCIFTKERRAESAKKHGGRKLPEYRVWTHMKARCTNPRDNSYSRYGGRGIKVCDRWLNSFENFLSDMGLRPSSAHSIDRVDNDGNYTPRNCVWATKQVQCRNQRTNHKITFATQTLVLTDWASKIGISAPTLRHRLGILGWSVERALTTPHDARRR